MGPHSHGLLATYVIPCLASATTDECSVVPVIGRARISTGAAMPTTNVALSIAEDAAHDRHQEPGHEEGDSHHGQSGGRAVRLVDAPDQRHAENAVADLRDRLATYKKEEISIAEGAQHGADYRATHPRNRGRPPPLEPTRQMAQLESEIAIVNRMAADPHGGPACEYGGVEWVQLDRLDVYGSSADATGRVRVWSRVTQGLNSGMAEPHNTVDATFHLVRVGGRWLISHYTWTFARGSEP